MPLSLVVFDLDGTLIDSAADVANAVNSMLADLGTGSLALEDVRAMIGDGMAKLVDRALAARECTETDPRRAQRLFLSHYEAEPVRATVVYPGVRAALEALRRRTVLAICTNKPARLAQVILEKLQLAEYFARVVGGDSLPYRKPDPRILAEILREFGTARREALMVGDSEVDAATAQAAGVPFVLMTHGYHRGPIHDIACLAAIDSFAELGAVIRALTE